MVRNKSGRESIYEKRTPSRRVVRWLGRAAIPVAVVSLFATSCSSSPSTVASPRNFFVTGVAWWHNGSESLSLVGCIPTSDQGRGGVRIGSNLTVGSQGSGGEAETMLGNSYTTDPNDRASTELTGTTLVDTSTGIDKPDGTIEAEKLDEYMNSHGTVAESLGTVPKYYAGALCVRYSVSPKSVRTFIPSTGEYSASSPFPSASADDQIGLGSEAIVNWAANTGVLTVLALPVS